MNSKQLIVLAVILGILILGVVLRQVRKPAELATEEYVPLHLTFDESAVSRIEISKPKNVKDEEYVKLVKQNETWKVESLSNAQADKDKITSFLTAVQEAKGEMRSKDKSLFKDFGIDDDKAVKILLADSSGNSLLTFWMGTKKAGFDSYFVRKDDSGVVYLTETNLLSRIGLYGDAEKDALDNHYWASTTVLELDPEKVERFEIYRFAGTSDVVNASVKRNPADRKWQFTRADIPFEIDPEKVKQYLDSFKGWRAQKVEDPAGGNYGFDKPEWRMNLTVDGKEVTVTAAKPETDSKNYPLQVSGEPVIFQLVHYYFENMDVDDSRFFKTNPLDADIDKTEKLIVHADKKEFKLKPKERKWDGLTNYFNDLKNLQATKLLFNPPDQKKVRPSGRYWIEIQEQGKPAQFLDVGEMIALDQKEYAAILRSKPVPFAVSESHFKNLFENLDRLKAPLPTSPPTPNTTSLPSSSENK